MKRFYNYLKYVNGMKNHSNWLGFDVKILKEGFKRGWERFKTGFPRKNSLKADSGHFATRQVARFSCEIFTSREWVAKASRWTHDWGFAICELPAKSQKTLILVFQHRICLNNEKQSKH